MIVFAWVFFISFIVTAFGFITYALSHVFTPIGRKPGVKEILKALGSVLGLIVVILLWYGSSFVIASSLG